DRGKPLRFTFNGRALSGYAGDTLASALLANGVAIVGRSFKYHRPRGLYGAGVEEPNAILDVTVHGRHDPNAKATLVPLSEGMVARSVNCWPGPRADLLGGLDLLQRFLPGGFYYKTFMRPSWHLHEPYIRRLAGIGKVGAAVDESLFEHHHDHCDVLVIGGGPAGLAAARAASSSGLRVILADDQPVAGGSLLWRKAQIDGLSGPAWIAHALAGIVTNPRALVLQRTTAVAYLDHNFVALIEQRDKASAGWARERLWKVRARQVILATGALERPLVFPQNDRPGIMSAAAVSRYLRRWGVRPFLTEGGRAVVFTNNDSAYETAEDLLAAGAQVTIVDLHRPMAQALIDRMRGLGAEMRAGYVVVDVRGRGRIRAVRIAAMNDPAGPRETIPCDVLAVSGGWTPTLHLHSQSGGTNRYDKYLGAFLPDRVTQAQRSAGAARGLFDLQEALADGHAAGIAAAEACGAVAKATSSVAGGPKRNFAILPFWQVDLPKARQWVDYMNDVTAKDVQLAARENYSSVEHLKRYTTLGMATDQGKTSNLNGLAILAQATGRSIPEVGTTTFRPPYVPVSLGLLASHRRGELHSPVRRLPAHREHELRGAVFDDYGGWRRPGTYPQPGEDENAAIRREALAVRRNVGLFDGSPLGKIEVSGPDAARFLNLIYYNEVANLKPGRIRYCLLLSETGKVYDDGVVARLAEDRYLLSPSSSHAAGVHAMLEEWLQCEYLGLRVAINNVTAAWATFAVTGPQARDVLARLDTDIDMSDAALPHMSLREGRIGGVPGRIARVSFTGERSFEISVPAGYGAALYRELMALGQDAGILPFGIESLMLLRAEKGYILIGRDTDGTTEPQDLGMLGPLQSKSIEYVGRRSLFRSDSRREDRRQFVGLLPADPDEAIPTGAHAIEDSRSGSAGPRSLGYVTSSYMSPTLGRSFALGLIERGRARQAAGETVAIYSMGRRLQAKVVAPAFYDPKGERLHG
ncbi:MAG TPA: sarcosine oxidase subunit alpha family protein, partial [Dongiaceae bacterium]